MTRDALLAGRRSDDRCSRCSRAADREIEQRSRDGKLKWLRAVCSRCARILTHLEAVKKLPVRAWTFKRSRGPGRQERRDNEFGRYQDREIAALPHRGGYRRSRYRPFIDGQMPR